MARSAPKRPAKKRGAIEAKEMELRWDFSRLMIDGMQHCRWSIQDLAAKTGFTTRRLERILSAQEDYTLETMGRVLHALGLPAKFVVSSFVVRACRSLGSKTPTGE